MAALHAFMHKCDTCTYLQANSQLLRQTNRMSYNHTISPTVKLEIDSGNTSGVAYGGSPVIRMLKHPDALPPFL